MKIRGLITALGLLAVSGCTSVASAPAPAEVSATHALQTRVAWVPGCKPESPAEKNKAAALGLLVAAIAPKVIEGAVDSAAAALKAAGQAKTSASIATNLSSFYGVSQAADLKVSNRCMVVVRGDFESSGASSMPPWSDYDSLKGLKSIQFLLAAEVKPLRGSKYFQLVPQYLEVNRFEEQSLSDRKDRDYTVAVAMTVPGGAQPFGSAEMTFKDIGIGKLSKPDDWRLRSATSLPIAFPAESADATKAKTKREAQLAPYLLAMDILSPEDPSLKAAPDLYSIKAVIRAAKTLCDAVISFNGKQPKQFQINEERCSYTVDPRKVALEAKLKKANRDPTRIAWANRICKNPKKVDNKVVECDGPDNDDKLAIAQFTYFTTQLTLSETREGSKFASFLGTALGAAKDDVAGVLKDKILPKTQSQKDAETEAERDARIAVLLSDLEVTKAEEELAALLQLDSPKPADLTAARIALLKTKISSNKAYRKADLPVRFPELS